MPDTSNSGPAVEEERICPECGSAHLVRDDMHGEVFCAACGFVLSERAIDSGPEWAAHSMEEVDRLTHTGPPRKPLAGASSLTTVIPYPARDIRGRPIPVRAREAFSRLRRLQVTSSVSGRRERISVDMGRTMNRIASHLGLPKSVREEAAFVCRRVIESRALRGRSAAAIVAASLYAACRIDGVPRTLGEVGAAAGIPRKVIARYYRELHRVGVIRNVPLSRPLDYVGRFCTELGLSSRVGTEAMRLLQTWDQLGISGSLSPVGTAATAIYLAAEFCGEPRHQTQVAKATGVTEVTLRSRIALARGLAKRFSGSSRRAASMAMRASGLSFLGSL